ncbi:hypothetical protein HK096_011512, partial [Nowakowskiella sp. JEL0078]
MDPIIDNVVGKQASENTKYYALYSYFVLCLSKTRIATIFCKSPSTISSWISQYMDTRTVARQGRRNTQVVLDEHIDWFMGFYKQNPLAFLDEAKFVYEKMFAASISISM